jgi:hypothetical protein
LFSTEFLHVMTRFAFATTNLRLIVGCLEEKKWVKSSARILEQTREVALPNQDANASFVSIPHRCADHDRNIMGPIDYLSI